MRITTKIVRLTSKFDVTFSKKDDGTSVILYDSKTENLIEFGDKKFSNAIQKAYSFMNKLKRNQQ